MAVFPSKEWCEQVLRLINDDPERAQAAQGWLGDLGVVVEAEPGRLARPFIVHVVPRNGLLERLEVLEDADELEALEPAYVARAPYSVWKALLQGTLDPVEAVLRRRVEIRGDMEPLIERLRFKGMAERVLSQLGTEFLDEPPAAGRGHGPAR